MQAFKLLVCATVALLSGCATGAVSCRPDPYSEPSNVRGHSFELGDADLFAGAFAPDGVYHWMSPVRVRL